MMESLATMSIWKLIVLGAFGIAVLLFIILLTLGTAAILGPGMHAVRGAMSVLPRHERPRMPVSVRVLGAGVVFLAVGLGMVLTLALFPNIGGWAMFGVLMLCLGIGLVAFYLVASRAERESPGRRSEPTSPDQHQ